MTSEHEQGLGSPVAPGLGRTGMVIRAGILLVMLCFLILAEWTVRNAARNETFDASVRLAEAAGRLRRATEKKRFFASLSQDLTNLSRAEYFYSSLATLLGHAWKPGGTDSEDLVRVWRFDPAGRLIDFHGSASEAADIENIWNGAILKSWQANGSSMTPDELRLMQRGQKAAQKKFSPFMSIETVWHASIFKCDMVSAAGHAFRLACVRDCFDEMDRSRAGWMSYLSESAMDPWFVERRIASALLFVDVDYCAIQHRGRLVIPKAHRLSGTSWRSLGLHPDDGRFLTTRFGTFAAFRLPGGHIIALGCRPGRIASIPGWVRLAAFAVCLAFALIGGREITRLLSSRQTPAQGAQASGSHRDGRAVRGGGGFGLQAQIFAMFFLASWVPLGTFLGIGLSEAADSKDAARRLWISRLFQRVESADRLFRNHLESLQSDMSELSWHLASSLAAGDHARLRRALNEKTQSGYSACYSADGRAWSKETKREWRSEDFSRKVRKLGELVFGKIIDEACGKPEKPFLNDRRITLDASDLLGETHPILFVLQSLGKIAKGEIFGREVSIFWDVLRDAAGQPLGVVFVSLTLDNAAIRFGTLLAALDQPDGVQTRLMFNSLLCPDNIGNSLDLFRMNSDVVGSGGDGGGLADVLGRRMLVAMRPSSLNGFAAFLSMMPYETILSTSRRRSEAIFGSLLLALLLVVGSAFFLNRRIAGPVGSLTRAGRRVAGGDDTVLLPVEGPTELSTLAASFNGMVEGLRQRERMRRYLSNAAWEASAGGSSAEQLEVAVLSSDIRGFTTLSERHSAGEIVSMLNEYFTGMERVIRRRGGDVDRFIGDAITAVFSRRPGEDETEHIRRAVHAGAEMRAALAEFNAARKAAGTFTVENGIGIDVGFAIRGLVGAVEGRRDLSIVGSVLSRAAECEAASRFGTATKIIVSSAVADRMRTGFVWRRLPVPESSAGVFELERLS